MKRIFNLSGGLSDRFRKAYATAQMYSDNITKQRDYQRNIKAMYDAYEKNDFTMSRLNADVAENRRYPRRVYMQGQSIG